MGAIVEPGDRMTGLGEEQGQTDCQCNYDALDLNTMWRTGSLACDDC